MGRSDKIEEDARPEGILASDPTLDTDIDLELILTLLDRQDQAWRQEIAQLRHLSSTRSGTVDAYDWMHERVQELLNKVSTLERISSGDLSSPSSLRYRLDAVQKMKEFKAWAAAELVHSDDPKYKNNTFVQTRGNFSRTLLAIFEGLI